MRTYNTIISACNRSGQPENALRVYERMLADGAQPTATTYTALISAYGKTGKVRWSQHSRLNRLSGCLCKGSRVHFGHACSVHLSCAELLTLNFIEAMTCCVWQREECCRSAAPL